MLCVPTALQGGSMMTDAVVPWYSFPCRQLYMHCGIIRGTTTRDPDKIFSGVNILPLIPSVRHMAYLRPQTPLPNYAHAFTGQEPSAAAQAT